MLTYFGEVRTHWRALLAALLGISTGIGLNGYVSGLFGPHLVKEFAWPRSQYALIGTLSLVLVLVLPIAGHMTDRFGVRRVAAIGVIGLPATFFAMSRMTGNFYEYFALSMVLAIVGAFTAAFVYSRLIAERFVLARGLGFAVIMSGVPLIGALTSPVLGQVIHDHGWRAGYQAIAVLCAVGGLLALLLIPKSSDHRVDRNSAPVPHRPGTVRADLRELVRSRVFWLIIGGMLLCNLPQTLVSAQITLMAMDSGASAQVAIWMMSLYAIGVMLGRFVFGISLDRFPAHLVATIGLATPALGFFGLASSFDAFWVLGGSVFLIGMAQGGEGDIAGYIVSRYFKLAKFGFIFGLVGSTMAGASAIGAIILSITLRLSDDFRPFIIFAALMTLVGALFFLFIGKPPPKISNEA